MTRYRLENGVLAMPNDEGLVLLDTRTETYYELAPPSDRVFGLLDDGATFEDAVAALVECTDGEASVIRADVTTFVAELVTLGILVAVEE